MKKRALDLGWVGLSAALLFGCSAATELETDGAVLPSEDVAETQSGILNGTQYLYDPQRIYFDDSVPGVHVAVTVCKTTTARVTQVVECPAHFGYALVGGGFRTLPQSGQVMPLVTESYPASPYYWHVSSSAHGGNQATHHLEVYAVGIQLEGATTDHLRKVHFSNFSQDANALSQTVTFPDHTLLSGGVFTTPGIFATATRGDGSNGWTIAARKSASKLTDFTRLHARLERKEIIQDFGVLEVRQQTSPAFTTGTGAARILSIVGINGWAVVGWGADSQTASGAGRALFSLGLAPDDPTARMISVGSADPWGPSTGTLSEFHTEARKRPGSHGMCSTGDPLSSWMDPCVASICWSTPSCCSTSWTASCVAKVTSECGKSCDEFTCSRPAFEPSYWSVEPARGADCFRYAMNTVEGWRPGSSHWWSFPENTKADLTRALIGDGLLPISRSANCPNNRTKIALAIRRDGLAYHFYRMDSNGRWSQKWASAAPTQRDDNGTLIRDPELAVTGQGSLGYDVQGYFCACSGAAQGSGKHRIGAPAGEEYPYPNGFQLPP